jgi:murein hydrolase activator
LFKQYRICVRWRFPAALAIALLLASGHPLAHAAKVTERAKQKRIAETERADLQRKLTSLTRDIDRTETAKGHAADALAHAEAAISEANRSLHELAQEQQQAEARLSQLSKQQTDLGKSVAAQQKQLAKLLREQYVAGNEDRIKLLLSGDNPNRINRDLQYMGYVSRAQARLIEALRTSLQAVESNQAEAQNAKDELGEIAQEQREQKAVLEQEQVRRAALLSQLSTKLATQRKEAGKIQRDQQRLAGLVDKLSKLIEEQQRAEAALLEKRRQDQARARAERDKQSALPAKNRGKDKPGKGQTRNPDAIDDDEAPSKSSAQNELSAMTATPNSWLPRAFSTLRGQLHLPLRGELIAKYGSKRGDGPNWKGLFIRAAEGAEVKAVAAGRIVFADWLRGFGNLIIVDHGAQYMSIYGNNQAVLKRPGDAVKAGDVIASAGNTGANEQSGLYFEMRHQGRAFDPLDWMSSRQ